MPSLLCKASIPICGALLHFNSWDGNARTGIGKVEYRRKELGTHYKCVMLGFDVT